MNNGLLERRTPDLLQLAAQALREDATAPKTPLRDRFSIEELDAALMAAWNAQRRTSEDDLVAKAARGMLTGLPPRTAYFRRDEARQRAQPVPEEYFGLTLGAAVPYPVILALEEGSSAALSFVRAGEQLTEISGRPTLGKSLAEVYSELARESEDDVTLSLELGAEETRRVLIRRSSLGLRHALRCRLLDRTVLYLKPGQVGPGTAGQAREAALSSGEMARRVILDLRESTFGYVNSGVALADVFIERGILAELRMRDKVVRWNARPGDPLERSATVVLVGPQTEQAAVVVAAALQDLKGVRTLGEPTGEAGEMTAWFWLEGQDALRLTVAQARRLGSKPLNTVLPDALPAASSGGEAQIEDIPCPGSMSGDPVASDPLVARALRLLSPSAR